MFEFEDEQYYDPSEDGYTHLNAYSKGRTHLGRMLSNFAYSPFVHEKYGSFNSVEGFYYWYCTGQVHDSLRKLSGSTAKVQGQKFKRVITSFTDEDISNIQEAIICKIAQHPEIMNALKECTLPIVHYYVMHGRVIQLEKHSDWYVDTLNDIRAALQQ